MNPSAQVSADTVAQALGVHRTSIIRRAARECWLRVTQTTRGGEQHLYPARALPEEVRTRVAALLAAEDARATAALAAGIAAANKAKLAVVADKRAAEVTREAGLAHFMQLPPAQQRKAEARAALVELARRYLRSSGLPQRRGRELFAHEYNAGRIDVPAWIREARPSVSANSIDNWSKALAAEGLARLGGRQGQHRRGSGLIDRTPELNAFIVAMLTEFPHAAAQHVMKAIRARFPAELQPGERTLERWLLNWKSRNEQLFERMKSPDSWRSKYQSAAGSLSAHVLRLNQRWEADSTKGDLLLADGQRHVIVGIIDVYTRRLRLQVSRSSSSAAVASTLRRALLDWGVPEVLVTDNGSDYVSQHIQRIVAGLHLDHDLAPPLHPGTQTAH